MFQKLVFSFLLCCHALLLSGQVVPVYYSSWKRLKHKRTTPFHDLVQIHHRSNHEIRVYGGNDFEILASQDNISPKTIRNKVLAIQKGDSLFLNGEKIKLAPYYCKVIQIGTYIVFTGSVTDKEQSHIDELVAIYGASGGFEARLLAEFNEKRNLYYLDTRKSKPKVVRIDRLEIRRLLRGHKEVYKKYEKELEMDSMDTMIRYMEIINQMQEKPE